jgi:hypothetical protein
LTSGGLTLKDLSTITTKELLTGWWGENWVRGLVLLLIPVGVIDVAFTLSMTIRYGPEIEFNPITREMLAAGFWLPWAIINILGFTFFCMIAGSYYLHSRIKPGGPDTSWLTVVISLRIAMMIYNVTYYYFPFAGGMVYPPFWTGSLSFLMALFILNRLLKSEYDVSWSQTVYYFKSWFNNRRDERLLRAAGVRDKESQAAISQKMIRQESMSSISKVKTPWWKGVAIKRLGLVGAAAFSYVLMGFTIQLISDATGLSRWSEFNVPFFVINEDTGPGIMASFIAIIFFIGVSLYLIFKAFSISEDYLI